MFERLLLLLWHGWLRVRGARLARGARVHPSVRVAPAALTLGAHARLYWGGDVLCHGDGALQLGAHSHFAPYFYCLIGRNRLTVGERVAVGPRCMFFCHSNGIPPDVSRGDFIDCHVDADIRIGNNVFIGAGVTVLPGSDIGDNVMVAAGAVVRGSLPSGYLYAGVPARKIKALC